MKKRNSLQIFYEILNVIPPEGKTKTKIAFSAVIEPSTAFKYLAEMEKLKLIEVKSDNRIYLTEKGKKALQCIKKIILDK